MILPRRNGRIFDSGAAILLAIFSLLADAALHANAIFRFKDYQAPISRLLLVVKGISQSLKPHHVCVCRYL
ncbi:hypothetical protein KCP76_15960 [Salmonella enterica subsp. enterica serovar Weltevreden]|nr:hypothetical protein KCP76_15960 [Salmonella enterica subsp. enterica serovar Weltevreden]